MSTGILDWSQCPAVESIPGKVSGAWVFKDTRLPVSTVFENLESGARQARRGDHFVGHRIWSGESGGSGRAGVFGRANPLANAVTATIGGQSAPVDFAGVVGAGLVQINVHVPSSINNGDAAIVATVAGVSTQTTANMIPVHN